MNIWTYEQPLSVELSTPDIGMLVNWCALQFFEWTNCALVKVLWTSIQTWLSIYIGWFRQVNYIVRPGWHVWSGWCLRWETAAAGPAAAAALRSDSWTLDTDTELQIVFLPQSGTASTDNEHPASQPRSGDFMNNQQFKRLKLIS